MASSGSFSGSIVSGHYKLRVDWSQTKNTSANMSFVTCKIYLVNDWSLNIGARSNTCTIDGTAVSYSSSAVSTTGTHSFGTASRTVSHSNDGTKTLTIKAVFYIRATINGTYYDSITASATVTLDSIPRASAVSATSVNLGTASTITISRASSSFTHTLTYKFGSASGEIATKTTATSVSWIPPLSLASQIPNATTGICTITCTTYSGTTSIGSKTCTHTLTVPASVKPTIGSLTAERIDGTVPANWGIYVQTKSKAKLTINSAAGNYGSTIQSYSISGGGFTGTAQTLTTGFLNNYGNITFTATVTDSRGRVSDAATVTIAVVRYFTPYFERYSSQRCNSAGTLLDDGTYVLGNALYNRAPCENLNQVTRSIFYKKTSDTEWTNSGYIFSSGNPIVFGGGKFSTEYSYDIKYTIQDAFNTVSVIDLISTASVIMDFKSGGKGVAVGKVSETDNVFEVSDKWDVKVYGKLLKDYIQSVAGAIYPVGSIYMSVNPTNPSTYFGGTWVAWGSGRVPVGINTADSNFSTVEKTGGASTVALTAAQMPSHSHDKGTLAVDSGGSHGHNLNLTKAGWGVDGASNKVVVDSTGYTALTNVGTAWAGYHGHTISGSTASAGSGSSHSNLQPYIVCYMWKRTA